MLGAGRFCWCCYDLPYRNLLRAVARLQQSRSPQEASMTLVERVAEWPSSGSAKAVNRASRTRLPACIGLL